MRDEFVRSLLVGGELKFAWRQQRGADKMKGINYIDYNPIECCLNMHEDRENIMTGEFYESSKIKPTSINVKMMIFHHSSLILCFCSTAIMTLRENNMGQRYFMDFSAPKSKYYDNLNPIT